MTDKKRIAVVGFGNNYLAYKMAVEAANAGANIEIVHGNDIARIENISDILQPVLENEVNPFYIRIIKVRSKTDHSITMYHVKGKEDE